MRKLIINISLLLLLILAGCNSADKFAITNIEPPIVPGIYQKDYNNRLYGVWQNPYSPSYEISHSNPNIYSPITLQCEAFPNPSDGYLEITFFVPYGAKGKMTIVPAIGPGEELNNSTTYVNGAYFSVSGAPIRTLFNGTFESAGNYEFNWRGRDDKNEVVPDGFYRVYLELDDDYLVWVDVFLTWDFNNLPPGMNWGGPEWGK